MCVCVCVYETSMMKTIVKNSKGHKSFITELLDFLFNNTYDDEIKFVELIFR